MVNIEQYKVDLNQLLTLNLILKQKNITKTAQTLGVSQPAISRTLASLRKRFNDELLVRHRQVYTLTPFASKIEPKLEELLNFTKEFEQKQRFNPLKYYGQFKIALFSPICADVAVKVIARVRKEAPNITLKLYEWETHSLDDLQNQKIDLAVGHANTAYEELRQRVFTLLYPSFAVLNDHPLAQLKTVDLNTLFSYPHIKVVIPGFERSIESETNLMDNPRITALETANITVAVNTFFDQQSLVINKAKYLPTLMEQKEKLTFIDVTDLKRPPGMELQLLWHNCYQNDLAHQWLRNIVYDEVADIIDNR